KGVPGVTAAAAADVATGIPGLGRHFQRLVLVGLVGIARYSKETPRETSGLQVVRGHVAARIKLRAAVADHNDLSRDLRLAGDGISALVVDERVRFPALGPVLRIQCVQDPLE